MNLDHLSKNGVAQLGNEAPEVDTTLSTLKNYLEAASEFIEKHPMQILVAAVAMGTLAALMSRSARSTSPSSTQKESV